MTKDEQADIDHWRGEFITARHGGGFYRRLRTRTRCRVCGYNRFTRTGHCGNCRQPTKGNSR